MSRASGKGEAPLTEEAPRLSDSPPLRAPRRTRRTWAQAEDPRSTRERASRRGVAGSRGCQHADTTSASGTRRLARGQRWKRQSPTRPDRPRPSRSSPRLAAEECSRGEIPSSDRVGFAVLLFQLFLAQSNGHLVSGEQALLASFLRWLATRAAFRPRWLSTLAASAFARVDFPAPGGPVMPSRNRPGFASATVSSRAVRPRTSCKRAIRYSMRPTD